MPRYIVKITYQHTEEREAEFDISAGDPDEAEELAAEKFYEDYDTEIDGVTTEKIGDRY
jgi:hypothetical protein